jgi:hypothetical protein
MRRSNPLRYEGKAVAEQETLSRSSIWILNTIRRTDASRSVRC